jgi:hypothetical protein
MYNLESFLGNLKWFIYQKEKTIEYKQKHCVRQGVVVHACNPRIVNVEEGGSRTWGQPGLNNENLSQRQNKQQ